LDDFILDRPREAETVITDFRQRSPGDGTLSSLPTTAYLSYDRHNLYVAFVCESDPKAVRGRVSRREEISEDDAVVVYLDTFRDRQRAFQFSVNPLGIQRDAIHTEGQGEDVKFNTQWRSDGRITRTGYAALLAIPFRSLRFKPGPEQQWGLALGRKIFARNEWSFWPAITSRIPSLTQQFGIARNMRDVSPGRNVQVIPYAAYANARTLGGAPPAYRTEDEFRGGVDAKVVVKDSLALDLTVNPDFSQVESNDPQVTINRRFEVFFPELRPFFLENAGFFQTPVNLFFSRRIVDPGYGARLTGKLGEWSVGGLIANDRAPGKRALAAGEALEDPHVEIGVIRLQRDFAQHSRAGILATSRELGGAANRVIAADTRLRLAPNWFLTAQAGKSYDRTAAGQSSEGEIFLAELARNGRSFNYSSSYTDRSPDFRTSLGFVPRVDMRLTTHNWSYMWWPEGKKIQSLGPSFTALANWDYAGRLQDWSGYLDFSVHFNRASGVRSGFLEAYEYYGNQGFRYRRGDISFYSSALRSFTAYGSLNMGSALNYNPAEGVSPFAGRSVEANAGFTLRPTSRFRWDQVYYFSRLAAPASVRGETAAPAFNNHQLRAKANYQFTKEFSFRAIVDYNATLPNVRYVWDNKYKGIRGDYLFTYLLRPGTAVHFGYSDRYENLGLGPDATWAALPGPTSRNARQVFVKLSYLLQF
jgi:hypothetical protein